MPLFSRRRTIVVRQEVYYVPKDRKVYFPHNDRPGRIWTLTEKDPRRVPSLPLVPIPHGNGYEEQYIQDWAWEYDKERELCYVRYYSKVDRSCVWILCEHFGQTE